MTKETSQLSEDERRAEARRDLISRLFNLMDFKIEGQGNLEIMRQGTPAIVAFFPHYGHTDGPAVRAAFPCDLRKFLFFPAASDYWYQKNLPGRLKAGLRSLLLQTFPMARADSGRAVLQGLDLAGELLRSGSSIVVSPEGTRSSDSLEEREFHAGTAELVLRTGAPVIPIRLNGFEDVMPRGNILPRLFKGFRRREVSVSIGEPMSFNQVGNSGIRREQRNEITCQLRERFFAM